LKSQSKLVAVVFTMVEYGTEVEKIKARLNPAEEWEFTLLLQKLLSENLVGRLRLIRS
jgi:hypothetical protein